MTQISPQSSVSLSSAKPMKRLSGLKTLAAWMMVLALLIQCQEQTSSKTSKSPGSTESTKPNILLICVDDLRPELGSFGANYISSPHIDGLAQQGISFQKHFVNAPSCGPSRYSLLTGQYGPAGNNALFLRSQKIINGEQLNPSMPEWFRANGYTTVSVGKVSHHPGGWGGEDWDDTTRLEMPSAWDRQIMPTGAWKHPRGAMHGLAHGEIRVNAEDMDVFQALEGADEIYPDGLIAQAAVQQIMSLTQTHQPFLLAVGLLKPHLPFGPPKRYLDLYQEAKLPPVEHPQKPLGRTTWHASGEFMKYHRWGLDPNQDAVFALEVRRHYAACVSYADTQIGKILEELKSTGADKNTIVVIWGDHGWHLGEHAIWGKHSLFEESLHSPLIIYQPGMPTPGLKTNAIVETVDIFPTLCDLTNIATPQFTQGHSLQYLMEDPDAPGHAAIAYTSAARSIRNNTHRLVLHNDGFVELYDHSSKEKETLNRANQSPAIVEQLIRQLENKLGKQKSSIAD